MLLMLLSCLGVTLFFCFRSLRTVTLAFAAVLWACPHSCHTYLLAPADSCYSLRNPTRVQVSWFCCLWILVSLYVDLFTACSIMFVNALCSESEARFDPPAGVLQYGLCSRIDFVIWFHKICLQTPLQYITWHKVYLQKSWYVEYFTQNLAFIPQGWIASNFQQ